MAIIFDIRFGDLAAGQKFLVYSDDLEQEYSMRSSPFAPATIQYVKLNNNENQLEWNAVQEGTGNMVKFAPDDVVTVCRGANHR